MKSMPLDTREEYLALFLSLATPATKRLTKTTPGLLKIGQTGTVYNQKIREAEGFLRLLWGYGPYYVNEPMDDLFLQLMKGIEEGVDPQSENYWGDLGDVNQLMVEMAPLAVFLILNKAKALACLKPNTHELLVNWLSQINDYQPARNNWLFFRVLVNVALDKVFARENRAQIEQDLTIIESFYLGNGWYYDGKETQIDYYVSFAIHYYALIYAVVYETEDPARSLQFKARAVEFATDFQYWFDSKGRGVPFGRSLTYRFAQSAFWSAMLYAGLGEYPLVHSSYLLKQNLVYWQQQAMTDNEGILTIGYAYPNLIMSEEYNGPGSPYWGLKSFLVLAIKPADERWKLESQNPQLSVLKKLPEAKMLLTRGTQGVQLFPAGQAVAHHTHGEAKYGKFVYASNFGFNVPKGSHGLERGAFDNVLALAENDEYFRVRTHVDNFEVHEKYLIITWQPWPDVTVKSVIIPAYPWHIRYHQLTTARELTYSDGGFSVPTEGLSVIKENRQQLFVTGTSGTSGLVNYSNQGQLMLTKALPNVNLLANSVRFPYFKGELKPGVHQLCHAFYGSDSDETTSLEKVPVVERKDKELLVLFPGSDKQVIRWN